MEYNDEKLLNLDEYAVMAKAYSTALKSKGYVFLQIDTLACDILVSDTFELFCNIQTSLNLLGKPFSKMAELNLRQLNSFQSFYPSCELSYKIQKRDKAAFYRYLSLESELLSHLLTLSKQSPFSNQLFNFIKERLYLTSVIFKNA